MTNAIKKIVAFGCAAVMLASFAACAKDDSGKTTEPSGDDTTSSTAAPSGDDDTTTAAPSGDVLPAITDASSMEEKVAYYVDAFNRTKAKTRTVVTQDGKEEEWFAMICKEELTVGNIIIEGKENKMINGLVPGIVNGMYSPNAFGLPVSDSRVVKNENGDQMKSKFTADDCKEFKVVDNKDGTITLTITPKDSEMAMRYADDSQGRFFNVLGDIGEVVSQIDVLTFAQGTYKENILVHYSGGTGVITIDTAKGEITNAVYTMLVNVEVNHASIAVLKDKSASLDITYVQEFPASAEWLVENKKATNFKEYN